MLMVPVNVEDLLDDAASVGCPGAGDAYFGYLFSGISKTPKPVKKGVVYGSHRGTYKRRKTYLAV